MSIVVVEDHESVQMVVREILISRGYHVVLCRDGCEALQKIGTHVGRLDLLLTDIVLPGMDGRQLSERARAIRADLRTLYMSGYSRLCLERFGLGAAAPFLQKPFTPDELIGLVQHTLSTHLSSCRHAHGIDKVLGGTLGDWVSTPAVGDRWLKAPPRGFPESWA